MELILIVVLTVFAFVALVAWWMLDIDIADIVAMIVSPIVGVCLIYWYGTPLAWGRRHRAARDRRLRPLLSLQAPQRAAGLARKEKAGRGPALSPGAGAKRYSRSLPVQVPNSA